MSDMLQLVVSGDGVSFDSQRQANKAYRTLGQKAF
jgi:signal transduction histidine kinase